MSTLPRAAAFTACACLAAGAAPAQTPPLHPALLPALAAAKAATGGAAWDKLSGTHETGTLSAGGLTGTYDQSLDWTHVKFVVHYAIGPGTGGQGWDGKQSWTTDSSGQVRVETSAEAIAGVVESAYFSTYAVYFPDRYPATVADEGSRTAGGARYDVVKITPRFSDPVELWFDAMTHLPARQVELTGEQPHVTLFSDFRTVLGVRIPAHLIVRTANDPKFDQVAQQQTLTAVPVKAADFAPPPPPAYDATFPAGKSSVTIPFRLFNNHIHLPVSLDGKPAVDMMFDTGATNFLDSSHAAKLDIKASGALPGGGFGNSVSSVGLAKVASVSAGGMVLHDQVFATNDLSRFAGVEGADIAGLIGYEFTKRAVTTIDYAHHTITFTKPDAFHAPTGATVVPFTFDGHIPIVAASVDGVDGPFEIDTGSRGAITLMHPFAQTNKLTAKYDAHTLATVGYGVGGPSKALLARIKQFAIGPATLDGQIGEIEQDARGAAAAEHTAGNIGGDILKRFTVTLDYAGQKMYLQPNAMAAMPGVFDRSGLWVNHDTKGQVVIADVTAGSAAAKAGLSAGDTIVSVNGKPAAELFLPTLRDLFKAAPGTKLHLNVKNAAGKQQMITLALANQV